MAPGETFEICAEVASPDAEFDFALHEDGISVYPTDDMGDITVHRGDVQLEWSHQRPEGWPPAEP
jgi:hypothetical protein